MIDVRQIPDREIEEEGKMGDTPRREKGVYPWNMLVELSRRARGKGVSMGSGMGLSSSFVV